MAWTINNGKLYFNSKLYSGNGGTNAQTGVGFAPNWVWIKNRSGADNHALYDTIRGANKVIRSNNTNAQGSQSDGLTAFGNNFENNLGNISIKRHTIIGFGSTRVLGRELQSKVMFVESIIHIMLMNTWVQRPYLFQSLELMYFE